jgi:hypothetical protein
VGVESHERRGIAPSVYSDNALPSTPIEGRGFPLLLLNIP